MTSLFFSYSHKDEALRNELEIHLTLLKRQGLISAWHDRRITAGSEIDSTISAELESANVILLLVSSDFIASNYCFDKEMARALEKHNENTAVVIPVILRDCDWHTAPFGHLRATPTDGKPVSKYSSQDEAFTIIAKDVREVLKTLNVYGGSAPEPVPMPITQRVEAQGARSSNLRIKRAFDDQEKDQFLDESYEYIARYFDASLDELAARNAHIKVRFKRSSDTGFSATIYDAGNRVAECSIWYEEGQYTASSINYSYSADGNRNGYNESLSVLDDGLTLQLKPLGMQSYMGGSDEALSHEGAAEHYWSMFIKPLQNNDF